MKHRLITDQVKTYKLCDGSEAVARRRQQHAHWWRNNSACTIYARSSSICKNCRTALTAVSWCEGYWEPYLDRQSVLMYYPEYAPCCGFFLVSVHVFSAYSRRSLFLYHRVGPIVLCCCSFHNTWRTYNGIGPIKLHRSFHSPETRNGMN